MTIRQVSKMTGISIGTLSRAENGLVSPRMETMETIAKGLNVKVTDLFESEYK